MEKSRHRKHKLYACMTHAKKENMCQGKENSHMMKKKKKGKIVTESKKQKVCNKSGVE